MHVINSHIGRYSQERKDEADSETLVFISMNKFDFIKVTL